MGRVTTRRRKARRQRAAGIAWLKRRRFRLTLESLELARGFDGPLRGAPEPCLLIAAYWLNRGRAKLVGRNLTRLSVPGPFPTRVELGSELVNATFQLPATGGDLTAFAILVFALEEDSGEDVQRLYAQLERPETLSLWDERSAVPELRALDELARFAANEPPNAQPVRVMRGDADAAAEVRADDWVGSVLARISPEPATRGSEWRFHFASPDGRNDWTAVFLVRVG